MPLSQPPPPGPPLRRAGPRLRSGAAASRTVSCPAAAGGPGLPALPRDPAPGRAALATGRGRGGERGFVRGVAASSAARRRLETRTCLRLFLRQLHPASRASSSCRPRRRAPGWLPRRTREGVRPSPARLGPARGACMPLRPAALTSSMLYFQMVIMAGTVMLAYYFEYTDTFTVNVQGFFCHDSAYRKPYPGPEDSSAVPPVLLYSLAAGVPVLVVSPGALALAPTPLFFPSPSGLRPRRGPGASASAF